MKKYLKVLEQNVEWIAVGLAALWLGWTLWAYVISYPAVEIDNEKLTAATADQHISDRAQRKLDEAIRGTEVPPIPTPPPPFKLSTSRPAPLLKISVASDPAIHPLKVRDRPGPALPVVTELPRIPAPTALALNRGFSSIQPPAAALGAGAPPVPVPPPAAGQPAGKDKIWVTVYASINDTAIRTVFDDAKIPAFGATPYYIRVELMRTEVKSTAGAAVTLKGLPMAMPVDPADKEKLVDWLALPASQKFILQPEFHQVLAGDQWFIPNAKQPANNRDPLRVEPSAPVGGAVPVVPGGVGGEVQPNAGGDIQIWQHDDTVEAGKTYQYRIRVIVKNPVFNTNLSNDPKITGQFELTGAWSELSAPITIPITMKWFVVAHNAGSNSAEIRIVKWENGKRNVSPAFSVSPGSPVAITDNDIEYDTHLIVTDIRGVGVDPGRILDHRVTLANADGRIQEVLWTRTSATDYGKLNREESP